MALLKSLYESFRTSGQFASGRRAFLIKNYEEALGHFQKVAAKRTAYVFTSGNFRESVWSYIGRCHYCLGKFAEARHALERAMFADADDHLARIFMGLTFARQGDDANGVREMERGLKGLNEWIENENSRDASSSFWDAGQEIRKEIASCFAMISAKKRDQQNLIGSVEWIGLKMEDEIDQVRRDKRRDE
jgi:tetratricopeptide (TPR) repeat protein